MAVESTPDRSFSLLFSNSLAADAIKQDPEVLLHEDDLALMLDGDTVVFAIA